jgi:small-conductance mechanosensitive channel
MSKLILLHPMLGLLVAIVLGSLTILVGWRAVLGRKPLPIAKALFIATICTLLGKLFVSFWHLPSIISYSVPTAMFLVLSYFFFKPTPLKFILYWIVGFASYLVVHIAISVMFGWTFMFPFWNVR